MGESSTLLQSFVPGRENRATKCNTWGVIFNRVSIEDEGASFYVSIICLIVWAEESVDRGNNSFV